MAVDAESDPLDPDVRRRWQELADRTITADHAILSQRVIKLADLPAALPPGTRQCSRSDRRKQLADRAASYQRRLTAD